MNNNINFFELSNTDTKTVSLSFFPISEATEAGKKFNVKKYFDGILFNVGRHGSSFVLRSDITKNAYYAVVRLQGKVGDDITFHEPVTIGVVIPYSIHNKKMSYTILTEGHESAPTGVSSKFLDMLDKAPVLESSESVGNYSFKTAVKWREDVKAGRVKVKTENAYFTLAAHPSVKYIEYFDPNSGKFDKLSYKDGKWYRFNGKVARVSMMKPANCRLIGENGQELFIDCLEKVELKATTSEEVDTPTEAEVEVNVLVGEEEGFVSETEE